MTAVLRIEDLEDSEGGPEEEDLGAAGREEEDLDLDFGWPPLSPINLAQPPLMFLNRELIFGGFFLRGQEDPPNSAHDRPAIGPVEALPTLGAEAGPADLVGALGHLGAADWT